LSDGSKKDRTYIVCAEEYIKVWGIWPEEDKHKKSILIDYVIEIQESDFRLPPQIAQKIYDGGESGMGYYIFTLIFNDGSKQAYITGGAVDFIPLPIGMVMNDIADVDLHVGRDDPMRMRSLDYYWCLYSK